MDKEFITKDFYGQGGFPQPYIYSTGYVTSAGAQNTSVFFVPSTVTVTSTGTGVYKITHKIGYNNRYTVFVAPVSTTGIFATVSNVNADDVEIRTFDQAGTATASDFLFTIYTF